MSSRVFHGGGLDRAMAQHGGRREGWLDLSTGINPVPWPVPAVSAEAWARLPDRMAEERLIAAARGAYSVPESLEVVAAPGTQALIETLPRVLPGKSATIVAPRAGTYREHGHCCEKAGRQVRHATLPEAVADDECLAILVNPNNPDGHVWGKTAIAALAQRLAARDGTLIVDEAFADCAPDASVIPEALPNTIVLRSFGKFFGLAGLRLGFAIAAPDIAVVLKDWFGPWAVSGAALEIGAAALGDKQWIAATRGRLQTDSNALAKLLEQRGFSIAGRNGLFVLGEHPKAADIAAALAQSHILVRPFPDRPGLIRFGLCAKDAELARLDAALSAITRDLA